MSGATSANLIDKILVKSLYDVFSKRAHPPVGKLAFGAQSSTFSLTVASMSYYSYGSPTAPYHPALAQDLRTTGNQQEYYQPNPPFSAYSAQPGSSYIGHYDRTSHAASYGSQFREQMNSLSHSSTRWQQTPYQTTYPASQDVRTWGPPYSRSSVYTGYTSPGMPYPSGPGYDNSSFCPQYPVRASVTRINELPPELLSHIFLETLPVQLCDARPHKRAAPLILSHVCRYWRDIAISLPSLWQRLCLTGCPSRHNHRRLRLAQTYMDRARGTGLVVNYSDVEASDVIFRHWDVVVCGQGLTFAPAADRCYCALDLLISRISEVRILELVIGQASTLRLSLIPPTAAAALRNLVVRFLEGGERTQMLSRLYTNSRSITQFTWASFHDVCRPQPPIGVPWSQLVSAHLDDCVLTHSSFLSIMDYGQRLTDVRVRLGCDHPPTAVSRAPVRQTRVAILTIYGNEPLDVVLNNLQLPSLRTLSLRSDTNDITVWPCAETQSLQQFIAYVSPGLDSFKISRAENVTEKELVALLELPQMSMLKSLSVYGPCIRNELFVRLHPGHGAPLAPRLTTLAIGRCTTTDGIITDMIQSRRTYGYPLQYADITFSRDQRDLHPRDTANF